MVARYCRWLLVLVLVSDYCFWFGVCDCGTCLGWFGVVYVVFDSGICFWGCLWCGYTIVGGVRLLCTLPAGGVNSVVVCIIVIYYVWMFLFGVSFGCGFYLGLICYLVVYCV